MVTGSGKLVNETRPLGSWRAVTLACPGTMELEPGANEGIRIEAEDNILPLIETEVEGERLVIRMGSEWRRVRPTLPIRMWAASPAIEGITVSGSGSVRAPDIAGEELALEVSGSGRIGVERVEVERLATEISGSGDVLARGEAAEQEIRLSGSGSLDARALASRRVHAVVSGSGAAMVTVSDELDGRISGSGAIVYAGAPSVTVRTSGSGRVVRMPGGG
jgi:hypothetical protein